MSRGLVLVLLVFACGSTFGQKKEKKKGDFDPLDVTELSESDALKVETILIDAERELIIDNQFKALELFKKALELDPDNAAINFKVAEILTQNGELSQALAYAETSRKSQPLNKYYLLLTAEIYKGLSELDKATEIYQEMIDNISGTETYLFDLAILYQYQGKFDEALETYSRAEDFFGMNEMVLREKQKIYLKKRDFESLIRDWDKLIAENEGNPKYTMDLCQFLISQNMLEEAKARLKNLSSSNSDILLSQIALLEGRTEEAIELAGSTMNSKDVAVETKLRLLSSFLEVVITTEEFDQISELTSSLAAQYPDVYEVQAFSGDVMYRLEKKDQALKYYLTAVNINATNFGVWQNILSLESEQNQFDSVVVHAERAMEYFPNQASLYYFAGTGYLIKQEYKKAIQVLDHGKKYATDPALLTIFYGQMGDAYNSMNQHEKSFKAYDKALEANPQNDHVLNNYSYFLSLRKQDLDRAIGMSSKLVEMHPSNPTYLDTHGWVLYVMERYDEALIYLRKAANLQDDGTVTEHYGDVLYKLGRQDEALEQWQRASELGEASENIQKKIADKKLYE
ncbi:MAG: tetratricopeptide repeat protein [Cyclobacteriaceae bacterium]